MGLTTILLFIKSTLEIWSALSSTTFHSSSEPNSQSTAEFDPNSSNKIGESEFRAFEVSVTQGNSS